MDSPNLKKILLVFVSASLMLLSSSQVVLASWYQDAGNSARTGYTPEQPDTPWTYMWSFNGSDATGGIGGHIYNAPKEGRTIMAAGKIFAPAGSSGLYALDATNGNVSWHITPTSFNATPAYDPNTNFVFAGGADGNLYKIDPSNGQYTTYSAGSPLNKATLIVGSYVYTVTDSGKLQKIRISDMTNVWTYSAGSTVATSPSYSSSRDIIIYATDDLYVHAVNNSDGSQKWRVKPTPNSPGDPYSTATQTLAGTPVGTQFNLGWPVVADINGVVLLRIQLPHQALYEGPNSGLWANTNAENRTWLSQNPQWQNLFALNLDDGAEKFLPVVGYGSTEDSIGTESYGVMGAQPVIKAYSPTEEVAYMYFRNGQTSQQTDFRWSGHLGEMVLNDTTITGLAAGDMRFIQPNGYDNIIDEQTPLTVAGNVIFQSHWAASMGELITNRGSSLGLSYTSPITVNALPPIVRALYSSCTNQDFTTHWANCSGMSYVTDGNGAAGRYMSGPGWFSYYGLPDPPGWRIDSNNTAGPAYSAGFLPRYTYVSNGYVVAEGNGGDIMVFKHSGTAPSFPPSPTPAPVQTACQKADINQDNLVDLSDYSVLASNFLKTSPSNPRADINTDGVVDLTDYSLLAIQFLKACQ